jgi:hypothetical protein
VQIAPVLALEQCSQLRSQHLVEIVGNDLHLAHPSGRVRHQQGHPLQQIAEFRFVEIDLDLQAGVSGTMEQKAGSSSGL